MTARLSARKIGLLFAAILAFAALGSDFLSTNPPRELNLDKAYAPPTRIHFFDVQGGFHLRPFVCRYELVDPLDAVYVEHRESTCPLEFFREGYPYRLLGFIPTKRHLVSCRGEKFFYPLGTDDLGRDVLARVLAGTRTSLLVVVFGLALYSALGLSIGALAGLGGAWTDSVLMRLSEFVLALPALYLILALRALLPARMAFWQTVVLTVGTIASVTWPPMARGVRGLILQLRHSVYVEASRALGGTRWQILRRHILPALAPFALTQAAVAAPVFLLGEVVLSFLDLGFHENGESWGFMLRNLKDIRIFTQFWWNLAPLAMVFLTLLSLNALSEHERRESDAGAVRL